MYLYDALGSELFNRICEQPEYYLTRVEQQILENMASELTSWLPSGTQLVELGSGSAKKTRILIESMIERFGQLRYVPIDISESALRDSSESLVNDYAQLSIVAFSCEYNDGLSELHRFDDRPQLITWLGSSIGNLGREEATRFLIEIASQMTEHDRLLVGIDLCKSPDILENAYNDSQGVTATFSKNILTCMNRELGGHFDLNTFDHHARFVNNPGRIETSLVSNISQAVKLDSLQLSACFEAGEKLYIEESHKYTLPEINALAQTSGLNLLRQWLDEDQMYSLNLFDAAMVT